MSKISKSGITVGQIIRAEHLLRIIDALSGEVPATQLEISGSVTASFFVGNGSQLTNLPTGSGGGTPGGSNTQIQFNSGSTFSGSANFRYNYANQSLAQGENVTISGSYSHAEGYNTQALGLYSHAEGFSSIASGSHSHAEGRSTQANGIGSHAEGYETITTGDHSHAEGQSTQAIGEWSHAEGVFTQAIGEGSHAEGLETIASGSYQHVQGQYNISSSAQSAFIIGNGVSEVSRSNLVFASGSQFQITGSLTVSENISTNQLNNTGTEGLVILGNTNITLRESNPNTENGVIIGTTSLNNTAYTDRTTNFVFLRRGWSAISGSSNLTTNALHVSNSINYVSSSGDNIARGLFINTTLTGVSDYRAIQTTTGSVIFNGNTTITGSLTVKDIIQLERRTTTPTPAEGMIIASGSAGASVLYYYNGTTWNALF